MEVQLAEGGIIELHALQHFYHPAVTDALSPCASYKLELLEISLIIGIQALGRVFVNVAIGAPKMTHVQF